MRASLSKQAVREIREWWTQYMLIPKPREIRRRYRISGSTLYGVAKRSWHKDVR